MLTPIRALVAILLVLPTIAGAQTAPSAREQADYRGLHAAAAKGDHAEIKRLVETGADTDKRDPRGRTPLMVAAHAGRHGAALALIDAGADVNALDNDRYDVVTIAAVRNDVEMVRLAIKSGANTAW